MSSLEVHLKQFRVSTYLTRLSISCNYENLLDDNIMLHVFYGYQ